MSLSKVKKELEYLHDLEHFVTASINITNDIASDLKSDKELPEEEVKLLEECMLDFIKLERDMKQFQEAAKLVQDKMSVRDENSADIDIDKTLDGFIRELGRNNSSQALKDHEAYGKFLSLRQVANDDSNKMLSEEEDMIIIGQSGSTTDPITKQEICDPVKNIRCGHIYSKVSILQYMKSKEKVRCPYVGCTNPQPLRQKDIRSCLYTTRNGKK